MEFEYLQYVRCCLVVPIILILFLLALFFAIAGDIIKHVRQHHISIQDLIFLVFGMLICCYGLYMNSGYLAHGGIHLIYERETSAVEIVGQIEEIRELDRYTFPKTKTEYGYYETYGACLTISGVSCTAIIRGTFNEGDYVRVLYLPRSGYVLSITETDPR